MGFDIRTDVRMTDRTETPRQENIGNIDMDRGKKKRGKKNIDMDFGDAQKESIEGSEATSLERAGNSQHNNVEMVVSHNKPKKGHHMRRVHPGGYETFSTKNSCHSARFRAE